MVRRSRPENGHSQPQRGRKLLSPNGHVGRNSKLPKRREPQLKNLRIFFQFTSAHSEPSHCIRACFCPRRKQAGSRPKDSTQPQRKPRGLEPGDPRHRTAPASLTANSRPEASNFAWPLPSPSRRATLTAARRRGTPDSAVRVQIATITSPPHNRQPMHRLPDQRCSSVGVYIDGL